MDKLERFQADVAALLQSDPTLQYTAVIIARPRVTYLGLTGVSLTQGSPTLTCDKTAGVVAGQSITGPGIPDGATVASITNGTTLVLSVNATDTVAASNATVTQLLTTTLLSQKLDFALAGTAPQNGKSGTAILVMLPTEEPVDDDQRSLQLIVREDITLWVVENVLINMNPTVGTLMSCESLAHEAVRQLQAYYIGDSHVLQMVSKQPLDVQQYGPGVITYEVKFRRITSRQLPSRCAKVQITGTAAAAVLTCSTPGARIWYTTDGSLPAPSPTPAGTATTAKLLDLLSDDGQVLTNDSGSEVLTGPLAVPSGTLLRAIAWDPTGTLAPSPNAAVLLN